MATSCVPGSAENESIDEYFDISGLIESQISKLVSNEASLQKSAMFNGVEDTDVMIPDSAGWRTELQSIIELDINKPVLRGRFVRTDGLSDENSNLTIRELVNKDENHTGVNRVQIYYLEEISSVRKITIERREKNPLYHSSMSVSVEFSEEGGTQIISRYNMKGYQKMILMDSSKYVINGTIIL